MKKIMKLVAILTVFGSMCAHAVPITYQVDLTIASGTVNGFVTTNGAQGPISPNDILGFDLSIFDGQDNYVLNDAIGFMAFGNGGVLATMTTLSIDNDESFGQLTFENFFDPGQPYRYVGFWDDGTAVIRHQATGNHDDLDILESGLQGAYVFATAASVAEPGIVALFCFGLAGAGFARRKRV